MTGKIAFIGLGAIGLGMARRILKAGLDISAYDKSQDARQAFADSGGRIGKTLNDTAQNADLLLLCVFNVSQVHEILFGKSGVVKNLAQGATVAVHTTMAPAQMIAVADNLCESGFRCIDAPVTGGVDAANNGTITVMAAGDEAAIALAKSAFDAMSQRVVMCGADIGAASKVKVINQLMVGTQIALTAEAVTLAKKAGVDPETVVDVVGSGAAQSFVWQTRAPAMFARDFAPKGVVDILVKDLGIVANATEQVGAFAPLSALALQLFRAGAEQGLGRLGDSALVQVFEQMSGIDTD
ncbi:MAG: NAD(P)-dependent oxidoreductase [Hyphomicrobiaceae bacterium]